MQGVSSRSWVAAALLGCAAITMMALLASNAASRPTLLMDHNYPAQYMMIEQNAPTAPAFEIVRPFTSLQGTVYFYQCQAMCREVAGVCWSKPQYSDDCSAVQKQCTDNCRGGNMEAKMSCYQAVKNNYAVCSGAARAEDMAHCKYLFINGVNSC